MVSPLTRVGRSSLGGSAPEAWAATNCSITLSAVVRVVSEGAATAGAAVLPPPWALRDAPGRAVIGQDHIQQPFLPEPFALGRLHEELEDVWQVLAVHDVLEREEAELALAAARRVRDHADRAGRGHGGHVGVPHPLATRLVAGTLPGGVHAALLGHAPGLVVADLGDELHDLLAHLD